jgi:hypothetical protein
MLNGWLSSDAQWFPCDYMEHLEFASQIEDEFGFKMWDEDRCISLHNERLLEKTGFIKIVGNHMDEAIFFPETFNGRATTKRQLDWLLKNQDELSKIQFDFLMEYFKDISQE